MSLKNFSLWNKSIELFLTVINAFLSVIGVTFLIVCLFYPERWNQTFTIEKKERYVQPPFRDSVRNLYDSTQTPSASDTITGVW